MKKNIHTFSEQVLALIQYIPRGRVMTYTDVARALRRPRAVRAVGNALHSNKKLVVIPCHRVVKSDGSIGGYAAGTAEKIKLLQAEGVSIQNGKVDLTACRAAVTM